MKVIHVINSLDPKHGGPSVCAPSLGAAQAALGHEVEFVFRVNPGTEDAVYGSLKSIPGIESVSLTGITNKGLLERLLGTRSVSCLASRISASDVVHMHGVWDKLLLSAALLARRSKKPYVFTPHGMLDPWSLAQRRHLKKLLLLLGVKRLLDSSSFLHALNESEAELLAPLNLNCPVRIFPNGIFPEVFADLPGVGSFRRFFPQIGERRYILFLSRLHYKKGLDYVAQAYARFANTVHDVDLVVAGPDAGARDELEKEIDSLDLSARVHITGPLYGQKKFAALRDAACFLLPSRQEGFSMAIIEAMASGLPVVISENCHFPEVEKAAAGCVVKLNPDDIYAALIRVVCNQQTGKEMGAAGRDLVFRYYTWERIAARMLKYYGIAAENKGCFDTDSSL